MDELLLFKDKIISGNDLELIFHKDYQWEYNSETLPIIKYRLTNCRNLSQVQFEDIDHYNDGVTTEVINENNSITLVISDQSNVKTMVICDNISRDEAEYRKEDYIDIIKSIQESRNDLNDSLIKANSRSEKAIQYLTHELETATRKAKEATWLSEEKKLLLSTKIEVLSLTLQLIQRSNAS